MSTVLILLIDLKRLNVFVLYLFETCVSALNLFIYIFIILQWTSNIVFFYAEAIFWRPLLIVYSFQTIFSTVAMVSYGQHCKHSSINLARCLQLVSSYLLAFISLLSPHKFPIFESIYNAAISSLMMFPLLHSVYLADNHFFSVSFPNNFYYYCKKSKKLFGNVTSIHIKITCVRLHNYHH